MDGIGWWGRCLAGRPAVSERSLLRRTTSCGAAASGAVRERPLLPSTTGGGGRQRRSCCVSTQADASYGRGLLQGVHMTGRRNARDSWFCFRTWIACACLLLCWVSPNLSAQTSSVVSPPAAVPAPPAPVVCAAPAATADHVAPAAAPGRVIASAGDIAGKSDSKSDGKAALNGGTKTRQWTVQVASFESLQDAQSMQQSLCGHGYDARIVGVARPYVVRVGRFATSQDALVAARRLSTPKLTVFVTQAER